METIRPAEFGADPEYTVRDPERMTAATHYFTWQSRLASRELGSRVVEVGCGIGNFTAMLAGCVAVDVEESRIEIHRERFRKCRHVRAEVMDAGSPDFQSLAPCRPDQLYASMFWSI